VVLCPRVERERQVGLVALDVVEEDLRVRMCSARLRPFAGLSVQTLSPRK